MDMMYQYQYYLDATAQGAKGGTWSSSNGENTESIMNVVAAALGLGSSIAYATSAADQAESQAEAEKWKAQGAIGTAQYGAQAEKYRSEGVIATAQYGAESQRYRSDAKSKTAQWIAIGGGVALIATVVAVMAVRR
jgi:hypothetical protein